MNGYSETIHRRLDAKHKYKKTKNPKFNSLQETYKLSLNGGSFGKTNEPSNWQYDPFVQFSCTIGNQFEILMLIERMELNNIHVVSANTDGIVCLFDKSLNDKYYEICKWWENLVGNSDLGQLEYVDYEFLYQMSVNDYIAKKTDGEIKLKGDFEIDKDFHKNKSMKVVRIALFEYFINGVPVGETIKNHQNVYDFCLLLKVDNRFVPEWHYYDDGCKIKELSKTTRYYISNCGGALYKRKVDNVKGKGLTGVNTGYVTTLFNKYEKKQMKDYNINYNFYITECMKIINQIENRQQEIIWD